MAAPSSSKEGLGRQELVAVWHLRVRQAHLQYRQAAEHSWRMMEELVEENIESSEGAFAVASARRAESRALAEYVRVRRIYENLVLRGKLPTADEEAPLLPPQFIP